jgi:hypothetical protein
MNLHWDAPLKAANASDGGVSDGDKTSEDHTSAEYVNLGIAVVAPIDKVLNMLEQSPLSQMIAERHRTAEEGLRALDSGDALIPSQGLRISGLGATRTASTSKRCKSPSQRPSRPVPTTRSGTRRNLCAAPGLSQHGLLVAQRGKKALGARPVRVPPTIRTRRDRSGPRRERDADRAGTRSPTSPFGSPTRAAR